MDYYFTDWDKAEMEPIVAARDARWAELERTGQAREIFKAKDRQAKGLRAELAFSRIMSAYHPAWEEPTRKCYTMTDLDGGTDVDMQLTDGTAVQISIKGTLNMNDTQFRKYEDRPDLIHLFCSYNGPDCVTLAGFLRQSELPGAMVESHGFTPYYQIPPAGLRPLNQLPFGGPWNEQDKLA